MANSNDWFASPLVAFGIGMSAYAFVLGVIALQNKLLKNIIRTHKNLLLTVVNLDLLAFLTCFHFIIAGHRFLPDSSGLSAVFSLSLYLFGLYIFHLTSYPYLYNGNRGAVSSASEYATTQLRLIAPFTLPFLIFSFFVDIATLFPSTGLEKVLLNQSDDLSGILILLVITGVFLVTMMLFFPSFDSKYLEVQTHNRSRNKNQT